MFVRKRAWKVAAVLAILIGVGAISVVGVNVGRYFYMGQDDDGVHIFMTEDGKGAVTMDADEVTDVGQTQRDLEEMKILSQQGKKELLKISETMTDGTLRLRIHSYRYVLSDGRTIDMGDYAGGDFALDKAQWDELNSKAGPGEYLGTYEETVEGRVFSFKQERYSLSDGTEVIESVGTPKDGQ